MTLRELMERRSRIVSEMRQITGNPAGQGGDLSDEQANKFDGLKTDLEGVEASIQRAQTLEDAERRMQGAPVGGSGDDRLDHELRGFSLVRAIASQVPGVAERVDAGRERELSAEIARRSGRTFQGMAIPLSVFHERVEQRTMTTTGPAGGPGSNLIATDHLGGQFIDRLRAALVVRGLGARILGGLIGNVDIPKLKTSATAGWTAENQALPESDMEMAKASLAPKHAGCLTEFSRNMLMQSSPDVEQLVRSDFASVLAEAVDRVAITGGGTNEPNGILSTAGIGSVAMGINGGPISWDAVMDLIGKVEDANGQGAAFITNTKVRTSARKTLKVSGDAAGGFIWGDSPNSLAGYTAAVSNLVPADLTKGTGTGLSPLIFGNFSDLILGYWSEFDLLVNPFMESAYKKGNVSVRGMLTMDITVRHAESFAAITDLGTA